MKTRRKIINTYTPLTDARRFRLRLFSEGILVGLAAGLVICGFRWALLLAEAQRQKLFALLKTPTAFSLLLALMALIGAAYLLTRLSRLEPEADGSGIPLVKGQLLGLFKPNWLRILLVKPLACVLAIGSGLSLGRAGPSIQLGAVAGQGVSRLLGRTHLEERYLLSGGAGAGLAAVFNAPLAGIIFVLEELHHSFSTILLFPALASALTATLVSRLLFGYETIFDFSDLTHLPAAYYLYAVPTCFFSALAGIAFNYGLLNASRFYALPIFKNSFSKNLFALLCAGLLGLYLPQVLGGGDALITAVDTTDYSLHWLFVFLAAKLLLTLFSFGTGIAGGAFIPTLVIGALLGSINATLLIGAGFIEPLLRNNIIILSMAAFLTASVRTPITAIVLIMEMTGSFDHLFSLAMASMTSYAATELCKSKPLYGELLLRRVKKAHTLERNHAAQNRHLLEVVIESGSHADNRLIKELTWPEHTLLVDIRRGEEELVPLGDTRLHAGDYLYILANPEQTSTIYELTKRFGRDLE